jgi:hypothetical protein
LDIDKNDPVNANLIKILNKYTCIDVKTSYSKLFLRGCVYTTSLRRPLTSSTVNVCSPQAASNWDNCFKRNCGSIVGMWLKANHLITASWSSETPLCTACWWSMLVASWQSSPFHRLYNNNNNNNYYNNSNENSVKQYCILYIQNRRISITLNFTYGLCQWHFVIGKYGQQSFVTTYVGPVVEMILRASLAVILTCRQPKL